LEFLRIIWEQEIKEKTMSEKFGDGEDCCKVCGAGLNNYRVLHIRIKHRDNGEELVNLNYFVPLCNKHRSDGCLDIDIGWEPDTVELDEAREDLS
jgi:hypothetical protein